MLLRLKNLKSPFTLGIPDLFQPILKWVKDLRVDIVIWDLLFLVAGYELLQFVIHLFYATRLNIFLHQLFRFLHK